MITLRVPKWFPRISVFSRLRYAIDLCEVLSYESGDEEGRPGVTEQVPGCMRRLTAPFNVLLLFIMKMALKH